MIHLGDRLGLYRAMALAGSHTAADLAAAHRAARAVAARVAARPGRGRADRITADGETFELTGEGAAVAGRRGRAASGSPPAPFKAGVAPPDVVDRLADAFRTGSASATTTWAPRPPTPSSGCSGHGPVWHWYPRSFPLSTAWSNDSTGRPGGRRRAAARASRCSPWPPRFPTPASMATTPRATPSTGPAPTCREAGLDNVTLHLARVPSRSPAEPTYDLVITFDCMHDMPRPAEAIAAIRRAIKPDGTLAHQGHPLGVDLGGQPAQPDAGHDVRHLSRLLHVVRTLRAGRSRIWGRRASTPSWPSTCAGSRASLPSGSTTSATRQPVLRGPALNGTRIGQAGW